MKNRTKWLVGALVVVLLVGAGVVLANPELYKGRLAFRAVRTVQPVTTAPTVRTVQQPVTAPIFDTRMDHLPVAGEFEAMNFRDAWDMVGEHGTLLEGMAGDRTGSWFDSMLGEREPGVIARASVTTTYGDSFTVSIGDDGRVKQGSGQDGEVQADSNNATRRDEANRRVWGTSGGHIGERLRASGILPEEQDDAKRDDLLGEGKGDGKDHPLFPLVNTLLEQIEGLQDMWGDGEISGFVFEIDLGPDRLGRETEPVYIHLTVDDLSMLGEDIGPRTR